MTVEPGSEPRKASRRAWLGLALVLLLDVWLRCHAIGPEIRARTGLRLYPVVRGSSTPLDCDEGIYAYIGDRLAHGELMYRDLTENKPPGGYWFYMLAVRLGGMTELTVRLMPIPMVLLTIALVWRLALSLSGPTAAVLSAVIYAIVSTDPYLYADGAQLEVPLNLFAVASLALFIAARDRPCKWWLFGSGLCLGAAILVKQVAALHGLVFVAALLFDRRTPRAPRIAVFIAGTIAPLLAAASILIVQGAGSNAYQDIFVYGRALASQTPSPPNAPPFLVRAITGNADPAGALPWPFGATNYLAWWGTGTWPIWLAALPALLWMTFGPGADARRRVVVFWTLSATAQVVAPGLFWPHYYMLPLPGLAIAVAVFLADLVSNKTRGFPIVRLAVAVLIAAAVVETARIQVRDYLLVPAEQLVNVKGGPQWIALRNLGREMARRSPVFEHPTLFVWGWQGSLYFYSNYDHVTPQVFVDDLMKSFAATANPVTRPRVDRTMRDLHARPPSLMFVAYPPFPELATFLKENYKRSRRTPGLWIARRYYVDFEIYPATR